jgi:hypothetical protein
MEPRKDVAGTALAACIVGLVICPVAYIALGIRAEFSWRFYFTALPTFALACGFLLWRYLGKPGERTAPRLPALLAEGVAWIVIARFLFLVSGIHLLRGAERIGVASKWFLVATAISLPIVVMRRTALQRRLTALPKAVVTTMLLLVLGLAAGALIADAVTPRRFI